MAILLFKDDESMFDLEASYTCGRCVSNYPSMKFGVRISVKTPAVLATADNTLDLRLVQLDRSVSSPLDALILHSFRALRAC
jgi:hypothetical protein